MTSALLIVSLALLIFSAALLYRSYRSIVEADRKRWERRQALLARERSEEARWPPKQRGPVAEARPSDTEQIESKLDDAGIRRIA